jgi:hypothetical protein
MMSELTKELEHKIASVIEASMLWNCHERKAHSRILAGYVYIKLAEKDERIAELEADKASLHEGINDYFSNDESLDKPVCCSGSMNMECGCRGITGRAEIEYSLRNQAAQQPAKEQGS